MVPDAFDVVDPVGFMNSFFGLVLLVGCGVAPTICGVPFYSLDLHAEKVL